MKKATELQQPVDYVDNVAETSRLFTIGDLTPEIIHSRMVEKGFWPAVEYTKSSNFKTPPRDMDEVAMLIVSEISEAVEANRTDRKWENISHRDIDLLRVVDEMNDQWVTRYEKCVKDCDLEEMADVMIRIMDAVGYYLSVGGYLTIAQIGNCKASIDAKSTFCASAFCITKDIADYRVPYNSLDITDIKECLYALGLAFCKAAALIDRYGGDVEFLVAAKSAYNTQRKARHGKSY